MAFATVKLIGDRLYAIHQAIGGGLHAERYFPQAFESAQLPLLLFQWGAKQPIPSGAAVVHASRLWTLTLYAGAWMAGLPSQSAQVSAETWVDVIELTYAARPRLELDGAPLDGVFSTAVVAPDNGLEDSGDGFAIVRWSLAITTTTLQA